MCSTAGTVDFAGSNGSQASCAAVLDAVLPGDAPHQVSALPASGCASAEAGVGCTATPGESEAVRVTDPPTLCSATGAGGVCIFGGVRMCACDAAP